MCNWKKKGVLVEKQRIIQINSYIPPLYRYLESQYVDLFFTMGILRISSFEHFANHPDESRLDNQEGFAQLIGNCDDSNTKVGIGFGVGSNSFTLCTSLIKSKELASKFKVDSCIKINNINGFIISVAEALLANKYNVIGGLHGPCRYVDKREISSTIKQDDIDKINIKDNTMNFNALFELSSKIANTDIYFLKTNSYAMEHEYRIIWTINNRSIPKCLNLYVPNAVQFCEKVEI